MMSQDDVAFPQRRGQTRLSRAKDGDDRHTKQGGQMHRASVVCQKQSASAQLIDQLFERRLADSVDTAIAEPGGDCFADSRVVFCAEHNPLRVRPCRDQSRDFRKTFRQPSLGWPVFRAWTKAEL